MRKITTFLVSLVCLLVMTSPFVGCSSKKSRQAEMMRNAIRRRSSDEEEESSKKPTPETAEQKPPAEPKDVAENASEQALPENAPSTDNVAQPQAGGLILPAALNKPAQPLSEEERIQKSIDNLERIGRALEEYREEEGNYPPPALYGGADNEPLLSWRVMLLSQLGYGGLRKKFNLHQPWDGPDNLKLLAEIPEIYQSPERFDVKTNYVVPLGTNTAFQPFKPGIRRRANDGVKTKQISDGIPNTAILLEVDDAQAVPWTKPDDFKKSYSNPTNCLGGLRQTGFLVGWGGGRVGWVPNNLAASHLTGMLSINGGEKFSLNELSRPVEEAFARLAPTPSASLNIGSEPTVDGKGDAPPAAVSTGRAATNQTSIMLKEQAKQAYDERREGDAIQLFHAANLVETNQTWYKQYRWFTGLKRPALAIRWGTSIAITGTDKSNVNPIEGARIVTNDVGASISELRNDTGELGLRLLTAARRNVRVSGSESIFGQRADIRKRKGNYDEDDEETDRFGARVIPENTAPVELIAAEDPNAPKYLSTGIVHLGRHPRATAMHIARTSGVDVLAEFAVQIKNAKPASKKSTSGTRRSTSTRSSSRSSTSKKQGPIYNTTTLTLIDVWSGRDVLTTPPMNNTQIAKLREDPLIDGDPVERIFGKVTLFIDDQLKSSSLPQGLRPEHARSRVAMLAGEAQKNPVPVLAEIRFYYKAGLISRFELREAYESILGSAGSEFETQAPANKLKLLAKWLPKIEQPN